MTEYWVVRWQMHGPHVSHTEASQGFTSKQEASEYLDAIIADDKAAEDMADPADRGRFHLTYSLDQFMFKATYRYQL